MKSLPTFVGIDPGTQGAICLLHFHNQQEGPFIAFIDTPDTKTMEALVSSVSKVLNALEQHGRPYIFAIEDVHSIHNMSAKSNFQFGRNLGIVEVLAAIFADKIHYLQPKEWQKLCGINFKYIPNSSKEDKSKLRKRTTYLRALNLYPNANLLGPKGGIKDGRADALMIAHALHLRHSVESIST